MDKKVKEETKGEASISRKTVVTAVITLLVIALVVVGICFKDQLFKGNTDTDLNGNGVLTNKTEEKQGDLKITDVQITPSGATNIVTGKVKNEGQKELSFTLQLQMYEAKNDRLLGLADKKIKSLEAGKEVGFEIKIIGDYSTVDKFLVEAMDLVEK